MNDDCCFPPQNSQSWIDLQHAKPLDILNLVADAYIGSTVGTYANSSNYGTPGSWATNSFTITSAPTCAALGTDNLAIVADAAQWNFKHITANIASTNAIPLRKVIFLRAGPQFQMSVPVSLGASTYTDLQLSFLSNAATRGDAQGTIPVIQWTGSFTGDVTLKVTLAAPGKYTMGLRAVTGGNTSMFEMEWIVVGPMQSSEQQLDAAVNQQISLNTLKVQSMVTGNPAGGTQTLNCGGGATVACGGVAATANCGGMTGYCTIRCTFPTACQGCPTIGCGDVDTTRCNTDVVRCG